MKFASKESKQSEKRPTDQRHMNKPFVLLHFRHYIYIFLAGAIGVFLVSGWFIYGKISNINQEFSESADKESAMEVELALESTAKQISALASDIIAWDEVHQQLANPAYYGYWKEQRASSRKMPTHVSNLDLYTSTREILGKTNDTDSQPNLTYIDDHYVINNNRLYYIAIFPIPSRITPEMIAGYLLIRSDVSEALAESGRLFVTDISSLRINGHDGQFIPYSEVLSHFEFNARSNPLFEQLLTVTRSIFIFGFLLIIIFTFLFYSIAKKLINDPLHKLTSHVEKLKYGQQTSDNAMHFRIFEFNNLKQAIDEYQLELTRINTNLDKKNEELWKLAHNDTLTGAANRRAYEEDWNSYISIANHKRLDFSFMLIDCDHFKAINDTYGHDTGDRLIITLVELLQKSLRDGDKLYRIGGDEFATILWNTDADTADKIAQRCLETIRSHSFDNLGINEPVTISIGIATRDKDATSGLEPLPRQADVAMYHAKKRGSRSIIHYNPSLESETAPLISNRIINAVIKAARSSEGIVVHYQPVVNVRTGHIDYYEALLRLQDNQGMIGAGDIFPVAENLSLEAELDLAVLTSIEQVLYNRALPAHTGVSVNFSAALFSLPDLILRLQPLVQYLNQYQIIFEVTEKTLITDIHMVSQKLEQLRRQGFQIALDDFGSGYSSIRYLANMPIDIVKFDISMTQQLLTEDKSRSIISGTATVIINSGFKLVAEGIENTELQTLVTNMGATHMQGYGLGKPLPLNAILKQAG